MVKKRTKSAKSVESVEKDVVLGKSVSTDAPKAKVSDKKDASIKSERKVQAPKAKEMQAPKDSVLVLGVLDKSGIQDYKRGHLTDAAFDVRANMHVRIPPNGRALIKTGLHLDIPPGYEVQVRPRSGIANKHGITVLNSPGTIDEHYVDECGVIIINHGEHMFTVNKGDRIAQFVLSAIPKYDIVPIEKIDKTSRGGGFGHTGVK